MNKKSRVFTAAHVRTLVWAATLALLLVIPLRIVSLGYLPPDDALRHAAKAVSGKDWQEILVMHPEITIDHNPGWHLTLAALHRAADWDPGKLAGFSVAAMFLALALSPLPWLKRPEAWLAAFLIVMVVFPYFADRAFAGRPLFLTMAVTLILLSLWTRPKEQALAPKAILLSVGLIAISSWVHGAWYLLALVPLAFFLARDWQKGFFLGLCWGGGSLLGALLTGEPLEFLSQTILIPLLALGQNAPANSLVGEFQPFTGGYPAVLLVAFVLLWRKLAGRSFAGLLRDPVFCLAALGWLLGFLVFRFWLDWGIPALALWLASQLGDLLETRIPRGSAGRAVAGFLSALVLLLVVANDRGGRWSEAWSFEALDASRPEHAGWVPEKGGVLYCVDLAVFYQTFFQNPHGEWRYILGFEPSFMRPQDLAVYQELWRTGNAITACAPWVARMTPADRLVLRGGPGVVPGLRGLEWHYAVKDTWVGRPP